METNLNLFYNEEANVTIRTQQVNNEPWFVAKDVANALSHKFVWEMPVQAARRAPAPARL